MKYLIFVCAPNLRLNDKQIDKFVEHFRKIVKIVTGKVLIISGMKYKDHLLVALSIGAKLICEVTADESIDYDDSVTKDTIVSLSDLIEVHKGVVGAMIVVTQTSLAQEFLVSLSAVIARLGGIKSQKGKIGDATAVFINLAEGGCQVENL